MIRVEGIRKRFGALQVLAGVNLRIERGRVTAIVGPNGSGKTTLIKMLLGLVRPDAGRIVWEDLLAVPPRGAEVAHDAHQEGRDLVLNGDCRYRERVGYMPQIVRFPENLSGRELLAMITDLRQASAAQAELVARFGLERDLDKPFRTLSGGTRQKVNAVLAFGFQPDLLILDEPTGGLDPVAARTLKAHVREQRAQGRTVLLTSHVMSELEALADNVAFLLDGQVRYRGTLDELKRLTAEQTLEGAVASLMTDGMASQ